MPDGEPESEADGVVQSFVSLVQPFVNNSSSSYTPLEKSTLINAAVNPGLYYGLAAGVAQFALLRRAPTIILRYRGLDPSLHQPTRLGLVFDTALSAAMTATVWSLKADRKAILCAAASFPLLPGEGGASDALCEDFVVQYGRVRREFWESPVIGKERAYQLSAIQTFVQNCQRRSAFKDSLRRERGLDKNEAVEIPDSGVPRNYAYIEDYRQERGNENGGGGMGSEWSVVDVGKLDEWKNE